MDWQVRGRTLRLGERTLLMGVVNVTPDSFSDGGRYPSEGTATAHALGLLRDGADILDVGGESTRPGADPVEAEEEMRRILPVITNLVSAGAVVSVDTSKASVAKAALDAGAHIVNDVTAGGDPKLFRVVADAGAGLVLMHMQGTPRTMQTAPRYDDVVKEVGAFLLERAKAAQAQGVSAAHIALDPGIGFGKTSQHNIDLIRGVPALRAHGYPILMAASRKAFLGELTAEGDRIPSPQDRLEATLGAHIAAAALGADIVRAHDIRQHRRAFAVADPILRRL